MTTIVYNHKDKELAVDSQATNGATIVSTTTNKIHRINNGWVAFAGDLGCVDELLGHLNQDDPVYLDGLYGSVSGLVMYDCGDVRELYINPVGRVVGHKVTGNFAIGSGEHYALGALHAGASARDAVKAAIKYDVYSSGRIIVKKRGALK